MRLALHSAIFGRRIVIPPEEVQEPMSKKRRQFRSQIGSTRPRLTQRGRDAHDHIAEQTAGAIAECPLALRECKDIGRAILLAIDSVEHLDLIVAGEHDRELCVSHMKLIEHEARATHEGGARHARVRAALDKESYRHPVTRASRTRLPRLRGRRGSRTSWRRLWERFGPRASGVAV
jgi:hypothetical protein